MAEDKSDQDAKDEIEKGMSEAGKDAAPRTGKKPGTGAGGSDQVARGMSEAGAGAATGAGASSDEAPDKS